VKALKEEPPAYSIDNKTTFTVILKVIWNQTAPLFKPPFLILTIIVFIIQYGNLARYVTEEKKMFWGHNSVNHCDR